MEKYEWRKKEKDTYFPKNTPVLFEDTEKNYITVCGTGHPNSEAFQTNIELLYALSYNIRMMPKKGPAPDGYFEYTVYPLEGIWDLDEEGQKLDYLDKNHLVYTLMIRQPAFVTEEVFQTAVKSIAAKKKHLPVLTAKFSTLADGLCIQMMHQGSYDEEPVTISIMEQYGKEQGFTRISKRHREIYITDARKTVPKKLKTVLRFKISKD